MLCPHIQNRGGIVFNNKTPCNFLSKIAYKAPLVGKFPSFRRIPAELTL